MGVVQISVPAPNSRVLTCVFANKGFFQIKLSKRDGPFQKQHHATHETSVWFENQEFQACEKFVFVKFQKQWSAQKLNLEQGRVIRQIGTTQTLIPHYKTQRFHVKLLLIHGRCKIQHSRELLLLIVFLATQGHRASSWMSSFVCFPNIESRYRRGFCQNVHAICLSPLVSSRVARFAGRLHTLRGVGKAESHNFPIPLALLDFLTEMM